MNNLKYVTEEYRLILRRKDLANALQVSIGTIDNLRRSKRLPEPIEISPRCIGWPKSLIEQWLENEWTSNR